MAHKKQPHPGETQPAPATSEAAQPDSASESAGVQLHRYSVLVAGTFSAPSKELAGLCEMGMRVKVVAIAPPKVRERIASLGMDEALFVDAQSTLNHETFRRYSGADLVVLAGETADELEAMLLPWMQEDAAGNLQSVLPLVRLDDPGLRFVRTGRRWGYYLVGRALGLGPVKAREFLEECCGHEKQNS